MFMQSATRRQQLHSTMNRIRHSHKWIDDPRKERVLTHIKRRIGAPTHQLRLSWTNSIWI